MSLIATVGLVYLSYKYGQVPASQVSFGSYLSAMCVAVIYLNVNNNKK